MRRMVGVGMGLPRHDGKVESVVIEDKLTKRWGENSVTSRLVEQPLDDAMIALVLLTCSQLRVDPIQPSSRAAS